MKPSARLQAAIDILYAYEKDKNIDHLLSDWGHRHRFAGSGDRRAIADTIYDIIREYGYLSWIMGGDSPRLLVLGWLKHLKKQDTQTIAMLFDGEKYAPASLSHDELRAVDQSPALDTADFTAMYNLPAWMESPLRESLGTLFDKQLKTLCKRAFFDVRVNRLKSTRDAVLSALKTMDTNPFPTSYSPDGIRFEETFSLKGVDLYEKGIIEVQDESSQIACQLLNPQKNTRILDYCAGGGGKSLMLAALTDNGADIIASDISEKRLMQLKKRAERAGATSIRRIHKDRLHPNHGLFDLVLVDAPCSGSGTWRRNIAEKWALTPEKLAEYSQIQKDVLTEAANFVQKGGLLAYTTCSLFKEENEDIAEWFALTHPHFKNQSAGDLWRQSFTSICPPSLEKGRILTVETGSDSFFITVFQKML